MDIKKKFGQRIKFLREQKGLSIEHLANNSNIDRNYLSEIEKGKRNVSIQIIEKLSVGLKTAIKTFFEDEE